MAAGAELVQSEALIVQDDTADSGVLVSLHLEQAVPDAIDVTAHMTWAKI